MKALVWHGTEDLRCDTVSNPAIERARHANSVMSCAIWGSDATTHAPQRRHRIGADYKITSLDIAAYVGVEPAHRRKPIKDCEHSDRNGCPRGVRASRGLARTGIKAPPDCRAGWIIASASLTA